MKSKFGTRSGGEQRSGANTPRSSSRRSRRSSSADRTQRRRSRSQSTGGTRRDDACDMRDTWDIPMYKYPFSHSYAPDTGLVDPEREKSHWDGTSDPIFIGNSAFTLSTAGEYILHWAGVVLTERSRGYERVRWMCSLMDRVFRGRRVLLDAIPNLGYGPYYPAAAKCRGLALEGKIIVSRVQAAIVVAEGSSAPNGRIRYRRCVTHELMESLVSFLSESTAIYGTMMNIALQTDGWVLRYSDAVDELVPGRSRRSM